MDIYRIYDAGEGVLDRFTVYLKDIVSSSPVYGDLLRECVILKSNGDWEHSVGNTGAHNGVEVGLADLPGEVMCTLNNLRYL